MQASLDGYYVLSACLAAVAVACRQTNAVWVTFILGVALLNKALETDPRAKRLPAEKQLLHVLRTCWKVKPFIYGFDDKRTAYITYISGVTCKRSSL